LRKSSTELPPMESPGERPIDREPGGVTDASDSKAG
jgi:hypothetical protein